MGFENDIPLSLAISAHAGTSFVPEERGAQERTSYTSTLATDAVNLARYATTDEKRALLAEEFERYRAGYRKRFMAYLASRSRCVSMMIAGPSKFPVRRMEKRNEVERRRGEELLAFRQRALTAIRRALTPELAPIMAGDSDATARLQAKIEAAEKLQETMKAANVAIRKHAKAGADAQTAALVALGFAETVARKLLEPDFCGRIGFADYQTKNNGAEIRRLRARLAQVSTAHATPATAIEGATARMEDVPAENRVRLFFPGKPAAAVRESLKRNGFRWTPSLGCWQAYRSHQAIQTAKAEARITED